MDNNQPKVVKSKIETTPEPVPVTVARKPVSPAVPPEPVVPVPTKPESAESKPGKTHRGIIAFLVILLVLSLAAAGVFAYLYFSNNTEIFFGTSTSAPTTDSPTTETVAEEVDITDTYVLRDLDEKIDALHLVSTTEPTIVLKKGVHHELALYKDGNLSDVAKLMHVINSLRGKFRYLNAAERVSVNNQMNETGEYAITEGIDFDVVAKKYKDFFGEELTVKQYEDFYCPNYIYNSEYDLYFDRSMCGGTSPYNNYYYKYKYTTQGDNAYVYVAATTISPDMSENAQADADINIVYCDLVKYWADSSSFPEVCDTITTEEFNNFTIDESNYQDFAQYRFVFHKADDGTYYFEKVEKL